MLLNRLFLTGVFALSVCCIGCTEQDPVQDPLYLQAQKSSEMRDFTAAQTALIACLEKYPRSYQVHRALADLYATSLDRPEYAVYHYEQSIRLNPGQDDAPNMTIWADEARKRMYNSFRKLYAPQEQQAKHEMEEKMRVLESDNTILKRRIQIMADRVNRANRPANSSVTPAVLPVTPATPAVVTPAAPTPSVSPALQRQMVKHTVAPNETLSSIAMRYYHSRSRASYEKILRANAAQLPNGASAIRAGMILDIPDVSATPQQ